MSKHLEHALIAKYLDMPARFDEHLDVWLVRKNSAWHSWSPLTNDGDLHRLALSLQLNILHENYTVEAYRVLIPEGRAVKQLTMDYDRGEATRDAIWAAAVQIAQADSTRKS